MFRPASTANARMQGSLLRNRQAAASAIIAGAITFALFVSADALAQPPANTRMAQEQHACAVDMGLHNPGDLYDTCIRSLDKTLSELDRVRMVAADRSACAQRGLDPGTPALAVCVVDAEQPPPAPGHYAAIAPLR